MFPGIQRTHLDSATLNWKNYDGSGEVDGVRFPPVGKTTSVLGARIRLNTGGSIPSPVIRSRQVLMANG